ncbi:TRAP transporter large permease [Ruegeria marina]|uniref:C4-dicarboxylate transporter, DctM subunit n=1 Tax=Ruegeria marina TaxID=639004 RepID=A0A1G6VGT2_9RHOB|nr:TRAP transporter large permease [Ruegeria marina]SDD52701.1 C4-dicarboxylate transporter, DctM subunit [Ruegeria marina]
MSGILLLFLSILFLVLRVNLILILIFIAGYSYIVWGGGELEYFAADLWSAMDRELVLAVPLFILVGSVMSRGSIEARLVAVMIALTRPVPGGLAVAAILSCAVFSAISGASIVTMLAIGTILYPAMLENGYSRHFSIGALAAGGTLGIVIPPSIPMIIYGIITESPIADLFKAGIGPGILLTGVFSLYAVVYNRKMAVSRLSLAELWGALLHGIPALLMPIILLGGIYSGYFSPTESAAVALLCALLIEAVLLRELRFRDYFEITVDASKMVGSLFPLIAIAASINLLITEHRVPHHIVEFMAHHIESQTSFLMLTNLLLLVMGCFMDTVSAITVAAPLLSPGGAVFPQHKGQPYCPWRDWFTFV